MLERPRKTTKRQPRPDEPEPAFTPNLRESRAPEPPPVVPLRPKRVTLVAVTRPSSAVAPDQPAPRRRARRRNRP